MKISSETIAAVLASKLINMETRYKALEELLIEKEPISEQAIEEKYKLVMARDGKKMYEEMVKQFTEGAENADKPVEYNESFGEWKDDPNKPWW